MKLRELTGFLESIAPLTYQESYDNSGLLVGDPDKEVSAALISLDCTEAIIDEALRKNCEVVISHHPIVFSGLKKLTGNTYVERVVIKAIKNDIAIYAIHTNLDHVSAGVNARICERLGIVRPVILDPKRGFLKKLVTFSPTGHAGQVRSALFNAGAGRIGDYSECSYSTEGFGTFKAGESAKPFVGETGIRHQEKEERIEVIYPRDREREVLIALHEAHPYEEAAFDLYELDNAHPQIGSGMIGWLEQEQDETDFLSFVKDRLKCKVIRHTALRQKKIKRVAVCGGAGSFLLHRAIQAGADMFITADFKYHDFFDADGKIVVADVGHFESEQFTQELLHDLITNKFRNFALHLTENNTNPINYLI